MELRWKDYVLGRGAAARKVLEDCADLGGEVVVVVGEGFDPRGAVGPQCVAAAFASRVGTIVSIGLAPGPQDETLRELAALNRQEFERMEAVGWKWRALEYQPTSSKRAIGLSLSRRVLQTGLVDAATTVVVDASGLPAGIALPLIAGLLTALEAGRWSGNLVVLVVENPDIDRAIEEEGADDPGSMTGLTFELKRGRDAVKVWAPVVGESQGPQLAAIKAFMEPDEVIPILPFPAGNPRRADDLMVEHAYPLLLDDGADVAGVMYAAEANPFDLYRSLARMRERLNASLGVVGPVVLFTSVHASKLLAIGALLAAWEFHIPVLTTVPTGYIVRPEVNLAALVDADGLVALWLTGAPYQ